MQLLHEDEHQHGVWPSEIICKSASEAGVTYVSLSHVGVHPRTRKGGPSACKGSRRTFMTPCSSVGNHTLAMSLKPY
jgi:hypothetical protein